MPYPGRRNLPDVTAAVASTLLAIDPSGKNWALKEKMLDFHAARICFINMLK